MLLILSLTLPMSTCSTALEEGSDRYVHSVERYIVTSESTFRDWLWVLGFSVPFGISLIVYRKETSFQTETACLLAVVPASIALWAHSVTGKLASGGILALVSILGFTVVTLACLAMKINARSISQPNPRTSNTSTFIADPKPERMGESEYAIHILSWIEKIGLPDVLPVKEAYDMARSYWVEGVPQDFDKVVEELWRWVDLNGGPRISNDPDMIVARMVIGVASDNVREVQDTGFMEDLIVRLGYSYNEAFKNKTTNIRNQ